MTRKTLSLVYFSPTGTTRRTIQNIALGAGLPVREIDRTSVLSRNRAQYFTQDDLVLLALPVYGGRLPRISEDFFKDISADNTPAALVVVYGNRHYDDALLELKNVATQKGFRPVAAGAFVGEHSYTRNVATDRPDTFDASAQIDFGRRFADKAHSGGNLDAVIPGRFPYEKPVINLQITPATSEACVNCQTCVEGCPMGAIDSENPRNVNREKCISCCYCIKVCPRGARRMEDPRILATINRLETLFTTRREAEVFF